MAAIFKAISRVRWVKALGKQQSACSTYVKFALQYNGCWCPGYFPGQEISNHGIELTWQTYYIKFQMLTNTLQTLNVIVNKMATNDHAPLWPWNW